MSAPDLAALTALLDILVPGDADFATPSALGLASRLVMHDRFGPTAAPVLDALPHDFGDLDEAVRTNAVERLELTMPAAFGALLTALYSLYYTDHAVLSAVAKAAGYQARPPQPEGYELPPFDPVVVAVPAARAPSYRRIAEEADDKG